MVIQITKTVQTPKDRPKTLLRRKHSGNYDSFSTFLKQHLKTRELTQRTSNENFVGILLRYDLRKGIDHEPTQRSRNETFVAISLPRQFRPGWAIQCMGMGRGFVGQRTALKHCSPRGLVELLMLFGGACF